MANTDNVVVAAGVATYTTAAHGATFSGDEAKIQITHAAYITGSEGSKTLNEIHTNGVPATTAYGAITRVVPTGAPYHIVTAASTNASNIKSSAGAIRSVHVYNNAAYPIYVKFHNTAGTPTAGSGVIFSVGCQSGLRADVVFPGGMAFGTGIGITVVLGITNADANAVALSDADVTVCWE